MSRPAAVAVVVLAIVLAWGLMYAGWRGRTRRQASVPAPAAVPAALAERAPADGVEATYVSTTASDDWLDRLAVHGLGTPSEARVVVAPEGVAVVRTSAPDVFVPAGDLRAVRRESVRAGKAVPGDGLVVWDWLLGDRVVSTAVRPRRADDRTALVTRLEALIAGDDGPDGAAMDDTTDAAKNDAKDDAPHGAMGEEPGEHR